MATRHGRFATCVPLFLLPVVATAVVAHAATAHADPVADSARGLIQRILPNNAGEFALEPLPKSDGLDVFELETAGGKIILRGSSGVAIASALNHYLNEYCQCSVSIRGNQLRLPQPLPSVSGKIRIVTPFQYRYCFNYCCFSYSMAWWDWEQWERAIDWMALNGINMPLAVTGQEATWQNVYRELGLTGGEIERFLVGPAYLPFGWMGCMDGWGGPLPQSWIDRHQELQKRILARERELGMTPVLQGFTGHVPAALKNKFPHARFQQLPSWCEFPGTTFIDPSDPLFQQIGAAFIQEQTRQYGTNHLYGADTFIEMSPPSNEPQFLDAMGKAVLGAMTAADPAAVWVMQGWLFVNNPTFWKPPQAKALLTSVPDDRMLVLDLFCESRPAWNITGAFHGKPWLWCIIHSFGDQVGLYGGLPQIAEGLTSAAASSQRGKLTGAGFIMEGLGYNPVVYDLMSQLMWRPQPINLDSWITQYAHRRYGLNHPKAAQAWTKLLATAYQVPGQSRSIITARPNPNDAAPSGPCRPLELAQAAKLLAECAPELSNVDTYQYDLVNVTRQVLANLASVRHGEAIAAFAANDATAFTTAADRFLRLLRDIDELLATRNEFLLGRWLADAKRWATNPQEERLYEWNARTQITLWGPKEGPLFDYAAKQWAGLLNGFYAPRWEQFFDAMQKSLVQKTPFPSESFDKDIRAWEEAWTHQTQPYPAEPNGGAVQTAARLLNAHLDEITKPDALSLTTGKPVSCSASLPPYPPERANDGYCADTNAYWATDVTTDNDSWWQVDLEQPTEVGRIHIVLFHGDKRSYEFFVDVSQDAQTWQTVADFRGRPQDATRQGLNCPFPPRPVRFIRVTVTNNSANTGRHLVEVMAYPR